MEVIILKLIAGEVVSELDVEDALYEMCDREHASCSSACLVYKFNGNKIPDLLGTSCGCDCFKSGYTMLNFIKNRLKENEVV
jgi:hypothetical protein